jgi:predicted O-linked N-acetylglucosamine transferase (SPINDLY family)
VAKIDPRFARALAHHQRGEFPQARALYCRALEADPANADVWQALGLLTRDVGETELAVRCLERAAAGHHSDPHCHYNLGSLYLKTGRLAEAERSTLQALRLRPHFPDALNTLGAVLLRRERLEEAAAAFEGALALAPALLGARCNLALANVRLGRLAEAERLADEALPRAGDDAAALNALAMVLTALGRTPDALAACLRALALEPANADVYCSLGTICTVRGQSAEAERLLREALRLRPGHAESHAALGSALRDQGRLDAAVACFREALRLDPSHVAARCNLGSALVTRKSYAEARACFDEALARRPDHPDVHGNVAQLLMAEGRVDEAEAHFRTSLALRPDAPAVRSSLLFCLNHSPALGPDELFAEHRRWGDFHGAREPIAPHANDPAPERRLRVGYVSADFRVHALSMFFEPVLAHHDAERFEITCYSQAAQPDAVTERFRSLAHRWRPTFGLSDRELVELVRADGIDILVDLSGHTAGNRLLAFARRPAPVQATYLGYLNTTGLAAIDYLLTDDVLHPPGSPSYCTEELFRLPRGYCTFTTQRWAREVGPLPALRSGRLTFGSLHNLAKLNGAVLDLWAEVLRAVPSARLLLYRDSLHGEAAERLRQSFAARGVGDERLDFRHEHAGGYMGVYDEIDLSLDAFPYAGGTTVLESLWMGVPFLTLAGPAMRQRSAASHLTRVGLPEFIADTPAAFVAAARNWAADTETLARVREGLRPAMARTICDAGAVTRGLEEAYREMWRRWCARR